MTTILMNGQVKHINPEGLTKNRALTNVISVVGGIQS